MSKEEEEFEELLKYNNSPLEPCSPSEHTGESWGFEIYYCAKCKRWLTKKGKEK